MAADPFSIAGSTVGVISLGLQVCNLLVSYCRSVKDADQDIQSIASKSSGLRVPLKTLRDILEEQEIKDSEAHPQSRGPAAQSYIRDDIKDKVKAIVVAIERLKKAVDKYGPGSAVLQGGLNDKFRVGYKRLAYPFRKESLRDILKDLDEIQMNLHTSLHIYSMKNINLIPDMIDLQKRTFDQMQNMSLLLENNLAVISQVENVQDYKHQGKHSLMPPSERNQESLAADHYGLSTILRTGFDRQVVTEHHPRRMVKRYNFACRRLGLLISASISLTRGAGGFSIAPALHFHAISPCKGLLSRYYESSRFMRYFRDEASMRRLISRHQQLFSEGKASPADILSNRENLLHRACMAFVSVHPDRSMVFQIAKFAKFLVEHGTPVDVTWQGLTALDIMTYNGLDLTGLDWLIRYLIDHGCYFSRISSMLNPRVRHLLQDILSSEYEHAVALPEIAKVIILESEGHLRAALESGNAGANDTIQSYSLLALSVGWPKGLQILLEAGANGHQCFTKHGGDDPLYLAIRFQYHDSLRLLLKAGCGAILRNLRSVCNQEVRLTLIRELASRRRRLRKLAEFYIPQQDLPSYKLGSDSLPDTVAASLYDALSARDVSIDPALKIEFPGDSVYHVNFWRDLPLVAFTETYNVGFHDIDIRDSSGRTPLMTIDYYTDDLLGKARWLVSRGASLFRVLPRSSATVFHSLACDLVQHKIIRRHLELPSIDDKRLVRFGYWIMQASIEDNCVCGCCLSGCTPSSMAMRRALQRQGWLQSEGIFKDVISLGLDSKVIMRSLTFDALGLAHTCCHLGEIWSVVIEDRDKEEAKEIRDEEKFLLETFEALLTELYSKLDQSNLPILDFLQQIWHPRIMDFLLQRDRFDQEHFNEATRLGVHLELEEPTIPYRISLMLGPKIQEVAYDSDYEDSVDSWDELDSLDT